MLECYDDDDACVSVVWNDERKNVLMMNDGLVRGAEGESGNEIGDGSLDAVLES